VSFRSIRPSAVAAALFAAGLTTTLSGVVLTTPAAAASRTVAPTKPIPTMVTRPIPVPTVRPRLPVAPQATLTAATVKFHTTNDDKDSDTDLFVEIYDNSLGVAAEVTPKIDGLFRDNTDSQLYNMAIGHPPITYSQLLGGEIEVRIDPNGNDTWNFDDVVTMSFSDGSQLLYSFAGRSLNQNNRSFIYNIH
jgi:hypothetical protein